MSIEIANESGVEVDTDAILAVARHALDEMGVNPLAELSILLVDIDYMTEVNHRWMGGDGPTDVLAFPMDEGSVDHGPGEAGTGEPALLGDIVLAPEVASKQAAAACFDATSGASTMSPSSAGSPVPASPGPWSTLPSSIGNARTSVGPSPPIQRWFSSAM